MKFFIYIFILLSFSNGVSAYIGPGLGLGLIGAILGLIFSFFVLLFAILWFPLKKILKKNKNIKKK